MHRTLDRLLAAAALALLAMPGAVNAGACCACAMPCAPMEQFYIVNQGPTYTGPGIVIVPGPTAVHMMSPDYPYVGRDYYAPDYPYYRKAYRSYVEPRRHRAYRRHVVKRYVSPGKALPFDPNDK